MLVISAGMVHGAGGCSFMLLLHPVQTSADAGPWCNHSICTGGGCYQLQLALVVLFHSAIGANTAPASGQLALCGGGQ